MLPETAPPPLCCPLAPPPQPASTSDSAITVVCWSGICGLGSIEIGSLGPINTLPFDHKSGSPESLVSLLPDINKPPVEQRGAAGRSTRSETCHGSLLRAERFPPPQLALGRLCASWLAAGSRHA